MLRQEQKYDEAKQYFDTSAGDPARRSRLCAISCRDCIVGGKGSTRPRRELESIVKESPQFTEAHVSLSIAYFRLKRPVDGNREREIVEKLTAEAQAKQPGVKAQYSFYPPRFPGNHFMKISRREWLWLATAFGATRGWGRQGAAVSGGAAVF